MTDNQTFLTEYVQTGSDAAFREIVSRYVDLVYSTALRLVGGDTHRAEDVAQAVFVDLARTARALPADVKLGGWLHRDTCFVAAKLMRGERRRKSRERQAVEMNALQSDTGVDFSPIAPILDEAINELGEADRTAILLRFFEQRDFRSVGQALGSNEDAARMRVNRALEKLQNSLKRRGLATSATALSVLLSANAIQAAPAGLAVTISTAAALAGTTLATTATATTVKTIAMTTLQKTLITVAVVTAAGSGVYEAHRASELSGQVQALQHQLSPLTAELQGLRRERDEAVGRLAALLSQNDSLRRSRSGSELLRLRAEVTRLRGELIASSENAPTASEALSWLERVKQLKERLEEMPEHKIPELELLSERDWLNVARDTVVTNDASLRSAFVTLRKTAKEKFAPMLSGALRAYARSHDNQLPANILQLQSYFHPPVSEAMLRRYEFVQAGSLKADEPAVAEKAPADDWTDTVFKIGAGGFWWANVPPGSSGSSGSSTYNTNDAPPRAPWIDQMLDWKPPGQRRDNSAEVESLERILHRPFKALEAVLAAQNRETEDPSEVLPFLQTAAEKSAFERLMQLEKEGDKEAEAANTYSGYLQHVIKAWNEFTAANPGKQPQNPTDLSPYLKTAEDQAALQEVLQRIGYK